MGITRYYEAAKVFILQHLFGWLSCIEQSSSKKSKGCYIYTNNGATPIYDPSFSFTSPEKFPPKLPLNSNS